VSETVNIIDQSGKPFTVDPVDLDEALRQGYRLKEQTGLESAVETGHAAALGLGSGLTAGLVEGATPGGTEGDQSQTVGQEEVAAAKTHPIAHGLGELAGMAGATAALPGGAIQEGLGATTGLGRIGAKALSGGVDFGFFGAAHAVGESALGDEQLNAQKILAAGGLGVALGALGGGVGGVLEEGLSVGAKKLAAMFEDSKDTLKEFASSQARRAAGQTQRDLKFLGEERANEVGDMMLERGHLGNGMRAPNARGILDSVEADRAAQGQVIGKVLDDVEASGARPDYDAVIKDLEKHEASLTPEQRRVASADIQHAKDAVMEYGARQPGEGYTGFRALNELKQDLQAQAKWGDPAQAFAGQLKRQLSGAVRDSMDKQLGAHLGPELGKQYAEASQLYGLLSDASRIANHGVERLANTPLGLRDTGIGAALGLLHGNPLMGVAGAIGSKVLRERGPGVAARLASAIADSPVLETVADHFAKALEKAQPGALGTFGPVLTNALAMGPEHALATHMVLANKYPDQYQPRAAMAGFPAETPQQTQAALTKAHGLTQLKGALSAHDADMGRAVDKAIRGGAGPKANVLKSQDFGAKRMSRDTTAAYEARRNEVHALAADPRALAERVARNIGPLTNIAPVTASAVAGTAQRAVAYLQSKLPAVPPEAPLVAKWLPSPTEVEGFTRSLEAVQNPMSVLAHAAAGTLTPDAVLAVKSVYPGLYQRIQAGVIDKLTDSPATVPYRQRVMLSLLVGTDLDGTMSQGAVARTQAAYAAAPANEGAPQKPLRPARESKMGIADRAKTPLQEQENA
jgi:hypothetical protein